MINPYTKYGVVVLFHNFTSKYNNKTNVLSIPHVLLELVNILLFI